MDKRPFAEGPVAPRVMLLSLWQQDDAHWHARLVDADASVREFDNPFELARYLWSSERPAQPPRKGGLR